jgi:membrane-bound lytic murein transglycosylase B
MSWCPYQARQQAFTKTDFSLIQVSPNVIMRPQKHFSSIGRRVATLAALICLTLLAGVTEGIAENDTTAFFNELQQRLITDGFDPQRVKELYQSDQVFFETRGISAYFMHNEATLDYKQMTKPAWISEAKTYMAEHSEELKGAQERFGVDQSVITAIILVETKFGRYLGKRSILSILSTMAVLTQSEPREYLWEQLPAKRRYEREKYDQKADQKAAWAYNELKAFLTYTAQHGLDAVSIVGSYAGALGIAQFMPSNILAYGQDGNGDGIIDLFQDADAIFSIAGYLKHYGWKPGADRKTAYDAVYHYNPSKYYVNTVLEIADLLKG